MKAILVLAMSGVAATLWLSLGCGGANPPSPSPNQSEPASGTNVGPTAARSYVGRVHFKPKALVGDRIAGALEVDGEPVSFEVSAQPSGNVRARFTDLQGDVVVATVKPDGKRRVRVGSNSVVVAADGSVSPKAFAGVSRSMRAAFGLVPLDLACVSPDADERLMEAAALPFNLLQRAEPGALAPHDLLSAASCTPQSPTATAVISPSQVLSRSKLVVAAHAALRGGT